MTRQVTSLPSVGLSAPSQLYSPLIVVVHWELLARGQGNTFSSPVVSAGQTPHHPVELTVQSPFTACVVLLVSLLPFR